MEGPVVPRPFGSGITAEYDKSHSSNMLEHERTFACHLPVKQKFLSDLCKDMYYVSMYFNQSQHSSVIKVQGHCWQIIRKVTKLSLWSVNYIFFSKYISVQWTARLSFCKRSKNHYLHKGGLILESFWLWLKSRKKGAKFWSWKIRCDYFFEDLILNEKLWDLATFTYIAASYTSEIQLKWPHAALPIIHSINVESNNMAEWVVEFLTTLIALL